MDDMSKASFNVLYDGPALANSEMDVRELAPALLALGSLLEEANSVINDGRAQVAVQVKATFKTGCFGIELEVIQSLLQHAHNLFSNESVASAKELLEWIGLIQDNAGNAIAGGAGLLWLIKRIRGRRINQVVLLDRGRVRVVMDDDALVTEEKVLALYRQFRVRQALENVLKPLEADGIDTFAVTNLKQTDRFIEISKAERPYFKTPEPESETLSEDEFDVNLQIVSISFQEGNKWRFNDGASVFYADMLDESFISQVAASATSFTKGDILKVRLRRVQALSGEQFKTDYTVTKVLEHRKAMAQLPMNFQRGDD
ncbi:hypothetical protein [Pseudomonas sp. RG1]|jgi:hypothetical protein|uniref:hypothetical protein n=1 Tax=unclassified Pseudomonas TaxID=196821 RepID=UPI0022212994|nr:hypothetical protein [Pseudomonas sp. RG1]MCW0921395.1 hypothetical protein [Pseudomonas sp. RG1]